MYKQGQGSKAPSETGYGMVKICETKKVVLIKSHHEKNETQCSL